MMDIDMDASGSTEVANPPAAAAAASLAELARHYPQALRGPYLQALKDRLQQLHDHCVAHTMYMHNAKGGKVTVTSRPKLVFSLAGPDGCFGLYIWGQVESDYFLVSVMPELGFELRDLLMSAFPEMELCNHMLITWSQAIPGHRDKRFSARSKQGKNETASEFYCLSIGPPRQMLLLDGNTVVRTIDFKDGDMIAIPGEVNSKLKHQVTGPPLNRGARVSIVWRNVSAHKVNVEESYFIKDGIQSHFAMADRRLQPELPPQLLARLLPLAPTASGSAPADGGSNFDAPSTGSAAEGGGSQDDAEGGGSQDDGGFQNGADHSASQDGVDVNFSC